MVAERERVFIVGVGCTAFTKVQTISASLCKAEPHTTQSHSREANDKPTKYDVLPLHFITIVLITHIDGPGGRNKGTPGCRCVLAYSEPL